VCHLRDSGTVQDEHHVVFECTDEQGTSNSQIGQRFSALENKKCALYCKKRKNCLLRPQGVAKMRLKRRGGQKISAL